MACGILYGEGWDGDLIWDTLALVMVMEKFWSWNQDVCWSKVDVKISKDPFMGR